jgi:hypothetical protein
VAEALASNKGKKQAKLKQLSKMQAQTHTLILKK